MGAHAAQAVPYIPGHKEDIGRFWRNEEAFWVTQNDSWLLTKLGYQSCAYLQLTKFLRFIHMLYEWPFVIPFSLNLYRSSKAQYSLKPTPLQTSSYDRTMDGEPVLMLFLRFSGVSRMLFSLAATSVQG